LTAVVTFVVEDSKLVSVKETIWVDQNTPLLCGHVNEV